MNTKELLLASVATWRLSHMLLKENGPFNIFRRARQELGITYYPESNEIAEYKYEITVCIWCLSMWVGGFITLSYRLFGSATSWAIIPYVLSAFSASWDRLLHRIEG